MIGPPPLNKYIFTASCNCARLAPAPRQVPWGRSSSPRRCTWRSEPGVEAPPTRIVLTMQGAWQGARAAMAACGEAVRVRACSAPIVLLARASVVALVGAGSGGRARMRTATSVSSARLRGRGVASPKYVSCDSQQKMVGLCGGGTNPGTDHERGRGSGSRLRRGYNCIGHFVAAFNFQLESQYIL